MSMVADRRAVKRPAENAESRGPLTFMQPFVALMPSSHRVRFSEGRDADESNNPRDWRCMRYDEFTSSVRSTVLARKSYNKMFCVGYNKTGTTTLEFVLRLYGLSLPAQYEQEIRLSTQTFATNYEPLRQFVSAYDAFQDMPFSQGETYVAADALFPNSKFILSVRDPDEWFESMCRFDAKLYGNVDISTVNESTIKKFGYLSPTYWYETKQRFLTSFECGKRTVKWDRLYDKSYYVDQYMKRNERIMKYFMNAPEKLLVIDITKTKTTAEICDFINIPREFAIAMPHENRSI